MTLWAKCKLIMFNRNATLLLTYVFIPSILYAIIINIASIGLAKDSLDSFGRFTQIPLAVIPLIGAYFGILTARKWQFTKSIVGKSVLFLSLSLLAWGFGMLFWLLYIFVFSQSTVPYPSWGDFFFFFIQPFSFLGVYYLGRVTGAQYGVKKKNGRILLFLVPLIVAIFCYVLLYKIARGGQIDLSGNLPQLFFDFYYPIVTSIGLALVGIIYFLSKGLLGGKYRYVIYILFVGLVFQFFGDFWYTYSNNLEMYFNGYWPDVLYTIGLYLISVATANISPKN